MSLPASSILYALATVSPTVRSAKIAGLPAWLIFVLEVMAIVVEPTVKVMAVVSKATTLP